MRRLKRRLPKLEALRDEIDRLVDAEDLVYRYYHQSWKVYFVQKWTTKIRELLLSLCPTKQRILDPMFEEIVGGGLPGPWEKAHNRKWSRLVRPQLEAFWHARYFLDMAIKYGHELDFLPPLLPSGWAALLELYCLRYGDLQLTMEIGRRRKLGHGSTSGKP